MFAFAFDSVRKSSYYDTGVKYDTFWQKTSVNVELLYLVIDTVTVVGQCNSQLSNSTETGWYENYNL